MIRWVIGVKEKMFAADYTEKNMLKLDKFVKHTH